MLQVMDLIKKNTKMDFFFSFKTEELTWCYIVNRLNDAGLGYLLFEHLYNWNGYGHHLFEHAMLYYCLVDVMLNNLDYELASL